MFRFAGESGSNALRSDESGCDVRSDDPDDESDAHAAATSSHSHERDNRLGERSKDETDDEAAAGNGGETGIDDCEEKDREEVESDEEGERSAGEGLGA